MTRKRIDALVRAMDKPTLLPVVDLCEAIGRTYSAEDMARIATTLRDLSEMFGATDGPAPCGEVFAGRACVRSYGHLGTCRSIRG